MASSESTAALESSEFSIFSVQELIKNPKITVPQCNLCSDQESPTQSLSNGNHHSAASTPIIDMESFLSKEDTNLQLEKMHSVCKERGIFQLVNHGVSFSLLENLKHEMLEFYELPIEEKMRYKIKAGEVEGYGTLAGSEGKLYWGDKFYIATNLIHQRKTHLLPELPSSLRRILESFILELHKRAMELLGMMARSLKMELKEIEEVFDDGRQSVRMAYYPPCPNPDLVMGLASHSDASEITILHQVNGVDGLQIKKYGIWIPARILPGALVVNVGDTLEIMSNGAHHSVEHRATVNSVKERISVAFFVSPKMDAQVGPATSLISPENPPLFKTVGMQEFVRTFFSHKLNGKSYLECMKIQNGEGSRKNVDSN